MRTKRATINLERAIKWEKRLVEKQVEQLILGKAEEIMKVLIASAIGGNMQAGQYLIDRTFGKARQNIGLDGGAEGVPIIFMPSVLVNKFGLDKPIPKQLEIDEEK